MSFKLFIWDSKELSKWKWQKVIWDKRVDLRIDLRTNDMQVRIFLIEVIFEALEAGEILEGKKCRKKSIEL